MSKNKANWENKSQITDRLSGKRLKEILSKIKSQITDRLSGKRIKQLLSENKSKSVVAVTADKKRKRVLVGLKLFNLSERKNSRNILSYESKSKGLMSKGQKAGRKILPKIVGDIRHYPPANKEWKNSIYAYNKNSIRSLPALDKMASKTIKSYFSLTNNKKLARSERMRNLIRRRTVKRLFVSKPEIKQTSDKVNITVYTFNREKQFLLRKMYFYDRNMQIQKNIFLYKLWLKKNMLALQETFKKRKSLAGIQGGKNKNRTKTRRKNRNKTYLHKTYIRNLLLKNYLVSRKSSDIKENAVSQPHSLLYKGQKAIKGEKLRKLFALRGFGALIVNNLLRSMQKRDLIKKLKKRENKKITSAKELGKIVKLEKDNSQIMENSYLVKHSNSTRNVQYLKKTFNNYLIGKINTKVNYKLRNFNSVVKIQKILRGGKRGGKQGRRRRRKRIKKIRLPYSNFKFKNEIRFFSFKLVSELKYIRKLFQFYFLKYILYLLHININTTSSDVSNGSPFKSRVLAKTKSKTKKTKKQAKAEKNSKMKVKIIQFKNKYTYSKLKKIELLNLELLHLLKKVLAYSALRKSNGTKVATEHILGRLEEEQGEKIPLASLGFKGNLIDFLYKKFEKKYFLLFLGKFFKREFLYINYYSKFLINQLKFGQFLPGLKLLISRIYAKKVELNIVNLKYPHLNTDIYTDSIATQLRKKLGLIRVMKKALSLAKLPRDYLSYNNATNLNEIPALTIHKSLDVKSLTVDPSFASNMRIKKVFSEDKLDGILNTLYPSSLIHSVGEPGLNCLSSISKTSNQRLEEEKLAENPVLLTQSKTLSVLNLIKYKWVSGVRLEAAGRLTRRYTASRSVFKYKFKGSLQNIDYSQKADISKKAFSTVMLRNHVKANSQYSFVRSKRRIGAFGVKAWLAGY